MVGDEGRIEVGEGADIADGAAIGGRAVRTLDATTAGFSSPLGVASKGDIAVEGATGDQSRPTGVDGGTRPQLARPTAAGIAGERPGAIRAAETTIPPVGVVTLKPRVGHRQGAETVDGPAASRRAVAPVSTSTALKAAVTAVAAVAAAARLGDIGPKEASLDGGGPEIEEGAAGRGAAKAAAPPGIAGPGFVGPVAAIGAVGATGPVVIDQK